MITQERVNTFLDCVENKKLFNTDVQEILLLQKFFGESR